MFTRYLAFAVGVTALACGSNPAGKTAPPDTDVTYQRTFVRWSRAIVSTATSTVGWDLSRSTAYERDRVRVWLRAVKDAA